MIIDFLEMRQAIKTALPSFQSVRYWVSSAGFTGLLTVSLAQSSYVLAEPAAIKLGETELFPEIRLTFFGDDNVLAATTNPQSESGIRIAPKLVWVAGYGLTSLQARYAGEYSSSGISATDYDDHLLAFNGSTEFSRRSRAQIGLSFELDSEKPGAGSSRFANTVSSNLDVTEDLRFGARHTYGAVGARGNIVTGIRFRDFGYQRNTDFRGNSSYTEFAPFAIFSLRVSGSTRATFSARYRKFDYDTRNENDRDQIDLFVGARWIDSEKFGGSAQIGSLNYSYPRGERSDGDDLGIELRGYYRPVSYSRFDVVFDRSLYNIDEGVENENSTARSVTDELTIDWAHSWSSRLSHRASIGRLAVTRECADSDDVELETGVELQYLVRRWLSFGGGIEFKSRQFDGCLVGAVPDDPDIPGNRRGVVDYDRQTFSLFVYVSL